MQKPLKHLLIVLLLLLTLTSCNKSKSNQANHRLEWWLNSISWDEKDRKKDVNGKGVTIAIIDSAVDVSHPDLKNKIVKQYNVDNIDTAKYLEHGTAVAGIICAYPQKKDGVLGIAPESKIISIVISKNESVSIESLIKGIKYAISCNVDIINISAGIINGSSDLEAVVDEAYNKGIVVVAASGNDLSGSILYPAKYKHVLSANSVDENNNKLFGDDSKSIYLPGGNIVTTYSSVYEPKKYVSYTGTSVSSPILTGTIALIRQNKPNISNNEIYGYFDSYSSKFNVKKILKDFNI